MQVPLVAEIDRLIQANDLIRLRDTLAAFRPPEIAEALVELRPERQVIAFRVLPRDTGTAVVAIAVALSLVAIVLWGTLVGSILPLVLRRLGFDPATSSAPFAATRVDVTGLVIYFTVGLVVLEGTLL